MRGGLDLGIRISALYTNCQFALEIVGTYIINVSLKYERIIS
jgi:hypothetical protein